MAWLETKVPPPIVAGVLALVALLLARRLTGLALPLSETTRIAAAVFVGVLGLALDASAVLGFLKARTTINPMRPANSSALVESGLYRFTRNPMYLGLALLLTAWCLWLGNVAAFVVLPLFVAFISRFQIAPEERLLAARFGAGYAAYRARVRRWL